MVRVFISAGEASGDALGAALLEALKARVPVEAFGMGGPAMAASGFSCLREASELNVMGLVEVLRHLPRLFALLDALTEAAIAARPDVAVLIDAPDFNVRLARRLRARGIPVVFYVGPSVWAWRAGRVQSWKASIDRLLVLFPFEPPIWRAAGVDVVHVGHPLVDEIACAPPSRIEKKTVALLPGSRRSEVRRLFPILLEAAKQLRDAGLAERFLIPVAPTLDPGWLFGFVARAKLEDAVELVSSPRAEERRSAMARAALALVASGTATLETALLGRAQVIFYKVSWLSYILGRWLMKVKHFGLPNIIAGREVAPELIQGKLSPARLAAHARTLLTDADARLRQEEAAKELRQALGPGQAAARAAEAVLSLAYARALDKPREEGVRGSLG